MFFQVSLSQQLMSDTRRGVQCVAGALFLPSRTWAQSRKLGEISRSSSTARLKPRLVIEKGHRPPPACFSAPACSAAGSCAGSSNPEGPEAPNMRRVARVLVFKDLRQHEMFHGLGFLHVQEIFDFTAMGFKTLTFRLSCLRFGRMHCGY